MAVGQNEKDIKRDLFGIIIIASSYIGVQMISDISSLQIISIFGNALDAGTLIYPISFTLRDVAQKTIGKKGTQVLILMSALINVIMAFFFWIISKLPIDLAAGSSIAWSAVLTPIWRITVASIIAELCSEFLDTEIYSFWVRKVTRRFQWSRVLVSNAFSVPVDSLIFSFLSFYGTMPVQSVWEIFWGNVIIKVIVTMISLPMIYFTKDRENMD